MAASGPALGGLLGAAVADCRTAVPSLLNRARGGEAGTMVLLLMACMLVSSTSSSSLSADSENSDDDVL